MNQALLQTIITVATLGATRMRLRMIAELSSTASFEEINAAHDSMHVFIDLANNAQAESLGIATEE